jgi:hypothetical protein
MSNNNLVYIANEGILCCTCIFNTDYTFYKNNNSSSRHERKKYFKVSRKEISEGL